jgi:phosphosulfolactate synthase (CoM biosynthesis protein A)
MSISSSLGATPVLMHLILIGQINLQLESGSDAIDHERSQVIESEDITENVRTLRTDLVASIVDSPGLGERDARSG